MMSRTPLRAALAAVLVACLTTGSPSPAAAGGPVMLAGHDPDDHGFQAQYAQLFTALRAAVYNGGDGILAIGANTGSEAANWVTSVASQMTPPQTVTFVNGSSISSISFNGFAVLYIPSTDHNVSGGISVSTEQQRLVDRAVDVANFITAGGGLFGLTQEGAATPYEYLGPFATVTAIELSETGDCDGNSGFQTFDNVTPTPLGATLGITNTNMDGCCWHNVFTTYSDFLSPLALANEPGCTLPQPIDGMASVIGCLECGIPGQLGLSPAQDFNPPGTYHDMTATLVEAVAPNDPIAGVNVTFTVISGPNAGDSGIDTTDANGQAFFSYLGDGGSGVDRIQATSPNPGGGGTLTTNVALKFWDLDCNQNSVPDTCDTDCSAFDGDCLLFPSCGTSPDANANQTPDECEGCGLPGPCDDGNPCTQNDTCANFLCAGTPIDCSGLDSSCTVGVCNVDTGQCQAQATNPGGSCNDGNLCTQNDVCTIGVCAGTALDCSGLDTACTTGVCNAGTGTCQAQATNNGGPCNDGNLCTTGDSCSAGVCAGSTLDCSGLTSACAIGTCNAGTGACEVEPINEGGTCNDGNACTQGETCTSGICAGPVLDCDHLDSVCTIGVCNTGTGACEAQPANEGGPCSDGSLCTSNDVCDGGVCTGAPADCSFLDSDCTQGLCDESNGGCYIVNANEGGPCDDGDSCNANDVCIAGACSQCGNGSTDAGCGETCDPPQSGICDGTCHAVVCGNDIIQTGEECDDGNAASGDGCSSTCQFEDKLCIQGTEPSVARQAKRVVFSAHYDYIGQNPDGNREIFYFDRKRLSKEIKRTMKREGVDAITAKDQLIATRPADFFKQLTDTAPPVVNELPSLNGSGRVVAFVSNGDIVPGAPGNPDGNREIYRIDLKRAARGDAGAVVQVTDTPVGVDNLNPNLRAYRGALLAFDSNGNLTPASCVGGELDTLPCASDADCGSGACGNPEGNREVFVYVAEVALYGGVPLKQLTAATSGHSSVGQNANYAEKATAFSSTADLLGLNPEGNSEIYRVAGGANTLGIVTETTSGEHGEASQGVRSRLAFTSNGDLTGLNPDGNREIFVWQELESPPFRQVGESVGCLNAGPSIDNRGRFVAFQSTCNRIASLGNPDQSIFVWDDAKRTLLPLVVRGELNAASARPQSTKGMTMLTYESNLGSLIDRAICFLNVRDFLKTLATQP